MAILKLKELWCTPSGNMCWVVKNSENLFFCRDSVKNSRARNPANIKAILNLFFDSLKNSISPMTKRATRADREPKRPRVIERAPPMKEGIQRVLNLTLNNNSNPVENSNDI